MNKQLLKQIKSFEKGDYIRVCWYDASDARGPIEIHKKPECLVDEWGIYLGMEGSPKHLLLGKHYVRADHVWEATRIPLMLVREVEIIAKHVSRAVFLRRYRVEPYRRDVVRVKDFGRLD